MKHLIWIILTFFVLQSASAGTAHFGRYVVGPDGVEDTRIERTTDGMIFTDSEAGTVSLLELYTATGYISEVTAGLGLLGGGTTGDVTLNIGPGHGLWATDTQVGIDPSDLAGTGLAATGGELGVIFGFEAGEVVQGNDPRLGLAIRLFDAIVAPPGGGGDYELISEALDAGAKTIYVKEGTYIEAQHLDVPDGGILVGENSVIDFQGGNYSVRVTGTRAYSTGTLSVNHGSTSVTGSGTTWYPVNLQPGDIILLGNAVYTIQSVIDNTHLTITTPYTGTDLVDASYQGGKYATATITNIIIGDTIANAFRFRETAGLKLVNCSAINPGDGGVSITDSIYPLIDGFQTLEHSVGGIHTLRVPGARIINSRTSGGNYGIYATGKNTTVKDSLFEGATIAGIRIDGDHATIEGGTVGNNAVGIRLTSGSENSKIIGVRLDNNTLDYHANTLAANPVIVSQYDYSEISANDPDTNITAAELETLSDGSYASDLHIHFTDPPTFQFHTGNPGDYSFDSTYFYVCRDTDHWERVAWGHWPSPPPTATPTPEQSPTLTPSPTQTPGVTPTPAELIAIASGDWNATTTWDQGRVPTINDAVYLASPYTVTMENQTAAAGSINTLFYSGELVLGGIIDLELGDERTSYLQSGLNLSAGPDLSLSTSGEHTISATNYAFLEPVSSARITNIKFRGGTGSIDLPISSNWTVETDSSMTLNRVKFTVQTGAELVLQPGSTLLFDCENDLDSQVIIEQGGTLAAEGLSDNRITIQSASGTMWSDTGNIRSAGTLTMNYCDVTYLGSAPATEAAIVSTGGIANIQNSNFQSCQGALLASKSVATFSSNTVNNSHSAFRSGGGIIGAEISDNVISSTIHPGIWISSPDQWNPTTGINIEGNVIYDSVSDGIRLFNVEDSTIHRNRIRENAYHGIAGLGSRGHISIHNNEIHHNLRCNIYLSNGIHIARFNTLDSSGDSWAGIGLVNSADVYALSNILTNNYYGIGNLDFSTGAYGGSHNIFHGNVQDRLSFSAFSHDTNVDPVYEATADEFYYRISYYQSPAVGYSNVSIAGVDIVGTTRPLGGSHWDAGAWEVDETQPTPTPTPEGFKTPTPTPTPTITPTPTPSPSPSPTPIVTPTP